MNARLALGLRLAGSAAGIAWVATHVDLAAARDSLGRMPIAALAAAAGLVALNLVVGAVRWRVLLGAYGATRIPPMTHLVRLYVIAFFYNNYLPGAVTGDVARGVVTRDAFEAEGATGALAVVLIERALGLFGLFALLAVGLGAAANSLDAGSLWVWTGVGVAGSAAVVLALPLARKIAPFLPRRLATIANKIPRLVDARAFVVAIGLSVATQAIIAVAGWVLLATLAPISFADSLLVVPLAAATAFLPVTVGGAGAREAVYIELCGRLFHMSTGDALAASLSLWLAHLAIGALGGAVQLITPRTPAPATSRTDT